MNHRPSSVHPIVNRTARALVMLLAFSFAPPALASPERRVAPGSTAAEAMASARVSLEQAEKIALQEVPGGRVLSIERDHEWGRPVFEVEMADADGWELELTIDATDGHILRRERGD